MMKEMKMSGPTESRSTISLTVLITTALCSALLILPGTTTTSMYFNDLLIFLDGGYRVVHGQVPNRDFHSALGPLSFYIPGLGYWLTGRLGMAMPVGMAALMMVMAPVMIHILRSRMRPLLADPMAVFLVLLLATPMNTGELPIKISFAMFYNRIGWVALGLLLVMHLVPNRPAARQQTFDTLSASLLAMILLYTKVTYGVVAIGFLLLMLLQTRQRVWAACALVVCAIGGALIELVWGGSRSYIEDLLGATQVSGVVEARVYIRSFLETSGEYVAFACLAALALWCRPRLTDLLFYGFCAVAGFALLNQNFQIRGIVIMLIGAAVAAEIMLRQPQQSSSPTLSKLARGSVVATIVLMLPIGFSSASAIALHTSLATTRAGEPLGTPNGKDLRVVNVLDPGQFAFYSGYARTLETGAALIAAVDVPAPRVLVMDFVSPFASLAGLPPPDGGTAWMHDNRNFNADFHFPAEEILGGVDVVMIPERPVAGGTTERMEQIYGDYLAQHFQLAHVTQHWRLYQRREAYPVERRPGGVQSS